MADNSDDLNKAVEQVQTSNEEATSEEAQQQQQATTSAIATGAEALGAQMAQEALAGESGATQDASQSSAESDDQAQNAATSTGDNATADAGMQQSGIVEGDAGAGDAPSATSTGDAATSSTSDSTIGAQSIGGQSADAGSTGTQPGDAGFDTSTTNTGIGATVTPDTQSDHVDTATNDNTFEVNVFDDPSNLPGDIPLEGGEEDFDTNTTTSTLEVTVTAENDAATSDPVALTMEEDGTITISQDALLANANDVDGDALLAQNLTLTNESLGTLNDNGDGTWSFTPAQDFNGDLDFSYEIFDGTTTTDNMLHMNVTPVNDLPDAQDQAFTMQEDGTLTFTDADLLRGAADVDGDDLSVSEVSYSGTDGVLSVNEDGSYSFAPNENFNGEVAFDFTVADGQGGTDTARIDVQVDAVNDAPIAGNTAFSMDEDSVITLSPEQLLAQSSDVEGDVSLSDVSYSGTDGILSANEDGSYSFAPNENFNGDITLNVTVTDEDGATATATAGIAVGPVNDAPVSGDLAYTINEDGSITLAQEQLLAQASDVEGDALSALNLSTQQDGLTITDHGDGTFTLTPDDNLNGAFELQFDVSDGEATVSAGITLTVDPVNDLPDAQDQAFTIQEDGTLTFTDADLLRGATDVDGDDLSVSEVSYSGTDGVLSVNEDGSYSFAPNENFNGEVAFDFTVADGQGGTDTARIDVQVDAVNDAPIAGNTAFSMDEDSVITLSPEQLLAQSSDVEGDVSLSDVSYSGTDGILSANEDGSYSFAPNENFNGDITLNVTVTDEDGATATATAGIAVGPVNDAPVSGDLAYTINEDGSITLAQEQLLAQASDVEGDALSALNLSTQQDGLTITDHGDGTFTLTPDDNLNGAFELQFDVSDGEATVSAGITLTVDPVNDLPDAQDQAFTIQEDGTLTFTDADLLRGATDVDGDDLSVSEVSYSGTDGVLSVNEDGSYSFAPNENFNGEVAFDFTVADGQGGTDTARIDVQVDAVNDAPIAGNTAFSMDEDSVITLSPEQLLAQSSDVEGDVSLSDVSYSGTDGILSANEDGSYSFAPNENFNGDITLNVTVTDEDGATATATAGIAVGPVNDAPVSGDLAYTINEDGSITLAQEQLLAQASDVEGDALSALNLSTQQDGLTITDHGDGTFTLTPDDNLNGAFELQFDVSDGEATVSAGITLTVDPVNDLPDAQDQAFTIQEDGTLTFTDADLLRGATDVDGDDLSVSEVSYSGTDGVLSVNEDGSYSFAPNENFNGEVAFDFTVADGQGGTDTARIDVQVDAVNDAPIAGNTAFSMDEDSVITLSPEQLLAQSSDVEGDVSLSDVSYSGTDGILSANEDGSYSFAPNENFNGDITLNVTVTDEDGATATATAGIAVGPVNDAPVSGDLAYTINEDGSITLAQEQLLAQASDVEGDALSALNLSTQQDGLTITDHGDGTFTLTPDENLNGAFELQFDVSDGEATISAGITLTVDPVNDLPDAQDQAFTMQEDGTLTFTDADLLRGAADVDGDDLSVSEVSYSGTDGVLSVNEDGSYSFAPNENFNGEVAFDFTVTDGQGGTDTARIDVQVDAVNDAPIAGNTAFSMDEDSVITLSPEQLLAQSSDVEGDVSLSDVSYSGTDGILSANEDGSYSFAPNENFNGDITLNVTVTDEDGATATATAGIAVGPVNDAPVSGDLAYTINEDGSITLAQEQLLAQASDVEGDALSALNLSTQQDGLTITDHGDGTFTLTPDDNLNGAFELQFDVSDGEATVSAGITLTVDPVNDLPDAQDDYTIGAGPGAIRLDAALEHGVMQYQTPDGNWNDMEVGVEYPADTEIQFVPDADAVGHGTMDVQIGSFGETASVDDWGVVDGNTAIFTQDGITVTTETNNGPITDWNGSGHIGNGIGDHTNNGLSKDDTLTVTVDGEDVNCISFELDGLGGWFDATSNQATQVMIKAFDEDGNLIDSQGGYRESGQYEDTYTFATDGPVHHFELGTVGGAGTYVVKNMTVARVLNEDIQLTTIQPDGSELSNSVTLNLGPDTDDVINLSDELIEVIPGGPESLPIAVEEGGVLTLSPADLLTNDSDIDGDVLTIVDVAATENTHGSVELDEDGNVVFTPEGDYNGPASFTYTVSDPGGLTDTATVYVNVSPENDAPDVEDHTFEMDEDGIITITQDDLLNGSFDLDGDDLSVTDVAYSGTDGVLTANGDGSYSFAPNENFSGDVAMTYTVTDGTVDVRADLDIVVREVNDPPIAGNTAFTMDEDSVILLSEEQLLANSSDLETGVRIDELNYSGTEGILTDNGDDTWSFAPNENFTGDIVLDMVVSDGEATDTAQAGIAVGPVNDAPVSGDLAYSVAEDGAITLNQEQLLSMASDVDGDALSASNLRTDNDELSITDHGDGTFTLTPSENFNGDLQIAFDVSDGEEVVTANIDLAVTPVNDLPVAPAVRMEGEEDQVLTIDPDFITSQVTDLDGDDITLENISIRQPENASLSQTPDGMYELVASQDWNGLIELDYLVSDGTDTVSGSLDVDVIPVNDAPFVNGNAHLTILEDGEITFNESDLVDLFGDVDFDDLSISRVITADGEDGGEVTNNGDGTWTFTPTQDFAGTAGLQVVVTDPSGEEATLDMPVYIRPVADGAVITTDHEGPLVFGEDSTGHLGLNVGLVDESEILSNLVMTGFPVGFVVSDGEHTITITEPGQYIDITEWSVDDIQMTPPEDFNGTFFITVSATTADYGDESSTNPNAPDPALNADFDIDTGESITFTTEDLLGIADGVELQEGDDVGLVHLIDRSQGEMVDNGDGTWTFNPAEGFDGMVDFAFVIERGDEMIDVQSTIAVGGEADAQAGSTSAPSGSFQSTPEGAVQMSEADLLMQMSLGGGMSDASMEGGYSVTDVAYSGDQGTLIDNQDASWTFWGDPEYSGDVSLDVTAANGSEVVTKAVAFEITADESVTTPATPEAATPDETAAQADYMAAPGDDLVITIPDEIAEHPDVEQVIISDLPEGAEVANALDDGDGGMIVSGDLSQPVTVNLGAEFEGDANVQLTGHDANGTAVEGASESVHVEVSTDHALLTSSADMMSDDMLNSDLSDSGMTTSVDITDDSSLHDFDVGSSSADEDYSSLGDGM